MLILTPSRFLSLVVLIFTSLPSLAQGQGRLIAGRVSDSVTQNPVTSGQVSVQGTTAGTSIGIDGRFSISTPDGDVILVIRSPGFRRTFATVPTGQTSIDISVTPDYFALETPVSGGLVAEVERRSSPTAVAMVTAEDLTRTPTWSVEQALQGKVPGAMITQNSGAPGGGVTVRLGGVTSISGAFTPLYVIDGIIASDITLSRGTNFVTQASPGTSLTGPQDNSMNRIGDLDIEDIERVEILKGAAATAMYGSKGSPGVIVITTKRGRPSRPRFAVRQNFGMSHIDKAIGARRFATGDTAAVRSVWNQAGLNAFIAANGLTNPPYFDHEQEIFGNTPLSHQTSASVSGGSEHTRYFASVLSQHDAGIMTSTFADKQGVRLNLDQAFSRVTLSLGTSVNRIGDDRGLVNNDNNGSSAYSVIASTPTFYDLRATCPDGQRRLQCDNGTYPLNAFGNANTLQTVSLFQNRETVWRFIGTGWLGVDVVKSAAHSLRLVAGGGTDRFRQENDVLSPAALQFEPLDGLLGTSVKSTGRNHNETGLLSLTHSYRPGRGLVVTSRAGLQKDGYHLDVSRRLQTNFGAGPPSSGTVVGTEESAEERRDLGVFAEEQILTLDERLLLVGGLRGDRSTNNGDQQKLYWYPHAGMSFRFPRGVGVVQELTLHGAVGTAGNEPLYGNSFAFSTPGSGSATVGVGPERQLEFETGFDATIRGNRASIELTVYQKRVSDLLLTRTLAPPTGVTTQIVPGGALRTRGLDVSLSAMPVRTRDVQLNSRVGFWLNRCTVTGLPFPATGSTGIHTEKDKSCTQYWGNDSLGRLPGDDTLGILGSRIVRYLVDINPKFNLTLANDLRFHALRLYALVEHQDGGYGSFGTMGVFDAQQTSVDYVTPRQPGDLSGLQRRTLAFKCSLCGALRSRSYVKLRELSLGVEAPRSLVHRLWGGARYVRLSLTGRNLLTLTPYPGTDPESTSSSASLARTTPSEFLGYPFARSVWLSIDLGF